MLSEGAGLPEWLVVCFDDGWFSCKGQQMLCCSITMSQEMQLYVGCTSLPDPVSTSAAVTQPDLGCGSQCSCWHCA